MQFYEVKLPYYALIKAETKEEAIKEYEHAVADNENNEVNESIRMISRDEALIKYTRVLTENGDEEEIKKIIDVISNFNTMTLIIDANLI